MIIADVDVDDVDDVIIDTAISDVFFVVGLIVVVYIDYYVIVIVYVIDIDVHDVVVNFISCCYNAYVHAVDRKKRLQQYDKLFNHYYYYDDDDNDDNDDYYR